MRSLPVITKWAVWALLFASLQDFGEAAEVPPKHSTEKAAGRMTLAELLEIAEEHNPVLGESAAQIEAERGRAVQAGAYPNPTLSSGAGQLGGSEGEFATTLSQEFVTAGKLRLDRRAACKLVERAEIEHIRRRFGLLTDVRRQFYATLVAQQRVEVHTQLAELAEQAYKSAIRLQQEGEGTKSDVLLLSNERSRAQGNLSAARSRLTSAHLQLAVAVGMPDLEFTAVEGDLDAKLQGGVYSSFAPTSMTSLARIQALDIDIERSRTLVRRAEVERIPNVTIEAGYQYNTGSPNNQAVIVARVPIPVWNRNQGAIAARRAEFSRSIESRRRAELGIRRQLAEAVGRFQAAGELVERYEKESLPNAREAQQIIQQGYAAGQFDLTRLLQAQRVLAETNLEYLDAQSRRWAAAADIAGILQLEQFP